MDTKLEELIDELQQEVVASNSVKPFNQPDLIAISSVNRTVEDPNSNGFSSFSVNLPLPAISVKSLQLLQTNIPQANANIPNTACVFWYYRLSEYSGLTPSINNLHYVRLLPTTYKQEYIYQPTQYGYNQTFNNYTAVATQLAKSCATDLLLNNVEALTEFLSSTGDVVNAYVPFIPNDISITYDTASNKFKMTGLNTQVAYLNYDAVQLYNVGDIITTDDETPQRAYINIKSSYGVSPIPSSFAVWVNGSNYAVGQVVTFNNIVYQLTTNGENVNQNPALQTPTYYTRLGRALPVASYTAWVSGTNYAIGDAVSFGGVVYVLFADGETTNVNPSLQPTKWVSQPTLINASTFWTLKDIEVVGSWSSSMVYPIGTIIAYQNALYISKSNSPNMFGELPTNTTYFDPFTAPDYWYRYLITGYDDPNVRKLQGELFNVEWNSLRTYNPTARVVYNGIPFVAQTTNRGLFPVISLTEWNNASAYAVGDVITYANGLYMVIQNTAGGNVPSGYPSIYASLTSVSSNPPLNAWSSGTTYALDDLVEYNGFMYYSVNNGNTGNNPFNNPSWWALNNYDTWNPQTTYQDKAVVLYNGYFYQTEINNNTNNVPTSFANGSWTLLGSDILTWGSAANYNKGDRVFYGGRVWEARIFNTNDVPTGNLDVWELISLGGVWALADGFLKTGLYGLTARYDMTEFIQNVFVLENFPFGVGGQPYNPNPRRLLNSILGFTWGGSFNPAELTDIGTYDTAVLTSSKQPLLYNRLRPIPDYRLSTAPPALLEGELGQDVAATVSLTYTADSYANLVYSSIISIYADIVKASSVDTQGSTRLLALTSMNCGNLGIAFWANYLENPLLKVKGDIYSVFIEFRDEFGEPFMLSNNAVATLTFKLNY
jgi:chitodextrinase